jgi:hypothetical protein
MYPATHACGAPHPRCLKIALDGANCTYLGACAGVGWGESRVLCCKFPGINFVTAFGFPFSNGPRQHPSHDAQGTHFESTKPLSELDTKLEGESKPHGIAIDGF